MAQASRGGDFERALAQGMVLPKGSCESAFSKELLRRRAKPELKENFEQEDGTVPSVLYRGVGLSGSLIAKILGSAPQHVMAAWTYTRLQEDLPPALQHSSLSALHVRERIYASLMSTLQVPPGVPPEDVPKIEVFQLLELSEDAMKNTIVGSDRSQIVSRSLSVSSSFAQAYTYAKLNVSAEKIGLVLAFTNIPGRGMPVVNKEWVIFSHIPKNTQLEAYLIFPKGEGVAKPKLGGTVFYDFAGYDLFRMRSAGTQWDGRLSVARCDEYVSQSGQALPTCHDEAFASQALDPSFPEGLRELIHEVKDEAAYRSSSEVEQGSEGCRSL